MDSKKGKNRDVKEILISIFPNIDREALDEVLNHSSNECSLNNSILNSDKNLINMSEYVVNTEDSNIINETEIMLKTTTSRFDQHFVSCKKEDNYLRAVRKAVTTHNLPTMPNININKTHQIPDFLKKTFKTILSRYSGTNDINKLKLSAFSKNDTIFTLNIAGSTDTEYAFEVAAKRFAHISESHKFVFAFIYPTPEEDKTNNYRNRRDIIMSTYQNNMRNLDADRFFFFGEERNSKQFPHPIQQVEKLSDKYAVSYMLTGFNSLKGSKGDNKVLEKALQIMLTTHRTPFIIMKESCFLRPESSIEGHTWLFVFDKINLKCFNSFKKFAPLIDFSKDKICGYTLTPNSNPFDDIQPLFMKEISSRNITKYEYDFQRYNEEAHVYVNQKVNFGITRYDFVVIYNNTSVGEFTKNIVEKQMISNMHIILGAITNICVVNGN